MAELITQLIQRSDTAATWTSKNPILANSEFGVESDTGKFKIGNGTTAWTELGYAGGNEAALIAAITAAEDKTFKVDATGTDDEELAKFTGVQQGDTAIIRRLIAGDKHSYTAYVYNNDRWEAMDGNYSADNVYFKEDLIYTAAIGALPAPSGGSGTITAKGKTVTDIFSTVLAKESEPSITQPSASITAPANASYVELGTTGTSNVTLSFNAGSYSYGYKRTSDGSIVNGTGVVATAKEIVNSNSSVAPTIDAVGSNNIAKVTWAPTTEGQSCSVIARVTYTGTPGKPVTNLKNESKTKSPIADGTATSSAKTVFYSYIPAYAGFKNGILIANPATLTSTEVSALSKKVTNSDAYSKKKPTSFTASSAWQQFFVAVPTTWGTTTPSAKDSNNLSLTIAKGANVSLTFGDQSIEYAVYYINLDAPYDTKSITVTW